MRMQQEAAESRRGRDKQGRTRRERREERAEATIKADEIMGEGETRQWCRTCVLHHCHRPSCELNYFFFALVFALALALAFALGFALAFAFVAALAFGLAFAFALAFGAFFLAVFVIANAISSLCNRGDQVTSYCFFFDQPPMQVFFAPSKAVFACGFAHRNVDAITRTHRVTHSTT